MFVKTVVVVATVMLMSGKVDSSEQMMKDMTKNFLSAYEACQQELKLPKEVAEDMMQYWKEGYVLTNRMSGCAIVCLSTKLDLMDPQGMLHKGKTTEFIKKHNVDDDTADKVINILHSCEANAAPTEDHCMKAIDIAMCFKNEVKKLNWMPNYELLLEEMAADMAQ